MAERSSESGGEDLQKLRFARAQSFFDKSLTIRLLISLIFAFFLFFFLHFREFYTESFELGSEATKYVVSQIDFVFPDEEVTIILKQKAAQEIGTIYRIEEQQIAQQAKEFQRYMTHEAKGWDNLNLINPLDDTALALTLFTDRLSQVRFTDIRTIQRLDSFSKNLLPLPVHSFFPYLPKEDKGRIPVQFWRNSITDELPRSIAILLSDYFERVVWNFEADLGIEYMLRNLAQEKIVEKYTRVRAGERVIDQGEKVTARHLAMLQAMKERISQSRNLLDPSAIAGSFLMAFLFMGVLFIYLKENHPEILFSNKKYALLATILILDLLFAKLVELFLLNTPAYLLDLVRFPLFVPFAAILLSSLLNVRIAAFASIFLAILLAIALAVDPVPFIVINSIASLVATFMSRTVRRRKEVFIICGKAWLAAVLVILAFDLYDNTAFSVSLLGDLVSTFLFMAMTAILVVGMMPMLESAFRILTDITLMEFMDPGSELLRRLTIEAPGTYQHSLVVGHLSEGAASAIGANGLFCRVATQYHDIGKLINPQYFTENQLSGIDMHQLLTPLESAQVIIAHVSEGVAMARRAGLPEQFIDIIKEHHGTTLVYYFYSKQIEVMGGDKSQVNERDFRYSGPKPKTKESTIIMIADTLEAASRSVDNFNEDTVTQLVNTLITQKMEDGQFEESFLTFEELGIIKRTLIKTLLAASHTRVKYPSHHPGEEG